MWEEYKYFAPVMDKVSAKWYRNLRGRYDFDELRNECVIAYSEVYPVYVQRKMQRSDFCKFLWVCCQSRIYDILRRDKVFICIESVQVAADSAEFKEMYLKFWKQYVKKVLSIDANEILDVIFNSPDELVRVHQNRCFGHRYQTRICREDLNQLFVSERGWTWGRLNAACSEVKVALRHRW